MIKFTDKEKEFLKSLEEARIATSHEDIPHVKPVSFIYFQDCIWIATDYDTRTYKNLKTNPNVAITIDVYKSGGHKAINIQGSTDIIENGEEFSTIYALFEKKFSWVRNEPWKENEAPFLKITPKFKISNGLK